MKIIKNQWKETWNNFEFEELIAMYINDCMQYLKPYLSKTKIDIGKEEFKRTKNQDLIYYGIRELKDLCIQIYGNKPYNWKDNRI